MASCCCCTATLSHAKWPQTPHKYNANKPGVKLTNRWPSLLCSRSCLSGCILLLPNSLSYHVNYIFNPFYFSMEYYCGYNIDIPSLRVHSSTILALQQSSQDVFWILINISWKYQGQFVCDRGGWVSCIDIGPWGRSTHASGYVPDHCRVLAHLIKLQAMSEAIRRFLNPLSPSRGLVHLAVWQWPEVRTVTVHLQCTGGGQIIS